MSLLNGSRSLAYVGGPTIGGLLVQVLGAPLAMLADALSFLGSVVFLRGIRSPEPPVEHEEGDPRAPVAGLAFVLGDPIIRPRARRRHDQPVQLRVHGAVHPVRHDDSGSPRGCLAWRSGSVRWVG